MAERQLRILTVADVPPDPDAGASGTQVRLVRWLRQIGHHVDSIWETDLSHRIRHGNGHDIFEKPLAYQKAIRQKWEASDHDVVCVNQPMGYLAARDHVKAGRPGVFIRWSMGVEYGLEQALREWLPRWGLRKRSRLKAIPGRLVDRLLYRQEVLIAKHAFGHIVLCDKDRDILVHHFRIPRERTANVHQAPLESFLEKGCLPNNQQRILRLLTVGQLIPYKGIYHIADTINRVLTDNPLAEFTWAGCGAANRSAALQLLNSESQERTTVPGKLSDSDFVRMFDSHGIFLFPSINEGFGKAFLEAMARGLCVVATSVGGMRDIIRDGGNGFIVSPGDIDGLVDRIRKLWNDPDLVVRMSRAARQTAEQYTWERVARDTAGFGAKMLELKSRGP